jgi:hypothetical protein
MKKVTAENYRKERWYPRVIGAVSEILAEGDVVTPVEVFIRLNLLRRKDLEDWRFRRIPYLEKIIQCNLSNANRILRVLRLHAVDRSLKPSPTGYMKWGKGRRRIHLRFSKTGDLNLEAAFSTHFISSRLTSHKDRNKGAALPPETDSAASKQLSDIDSHL